MKMKTRLMPWLRPLRIIASPVDDVDPGDIKRGVVWLKWPAAFLEDTNEGSKKSMEMAIEALELLALIGASNQATWRLLVKEMWPQAAALWRDADESQVFHLGVQVDIYKNGVAPKLKHRFLLEDVSGVVSNGYAELRDELEKTLNDQGLELPVVPIFVQVDEDVGGAETQAPGADRREPFETLLLQVMESVWPHCERVGGLNGKKQPKTGKWAELFRVSDAEVVGSQGLFSSRVFIIVRQLAALGIRLKHLRLDISAMEHDGVDLHTPSLIHFLVADETVVLRNRTNPWLVPVDSVGMDSYTSSKTYDCIFSALMLSRTIRVLSVGTLDFTLSTNGVRPKHRDHLWRWIALVFRGYMLRPLDEFRFWAGSLTAKDLEIFDQAMKAENPFALIFPSASTKRVREINTAVNASTFYLTIPKARTKTKKNRVGPKTPNDEGEAHTWWRQPLRNLRVIDVDRDWLGVFLPGWGKAWVKRADATLVKVPATREQKTPGVRQFSVEYVTERQKENVLTLLRLVGKGLKGLSLKTDMPSCPPRDHFIREVFGACPDLEELTCSYLSLTSLESIAWCYEEKYCRAKKLTLVIAPVSGIAHAAHFFDSLADEDHPMAVHLRELDLTITPRMHNPLAKVLESALDMLVSNQLIYNFNLCVRVFKDKDQVGVVEQALLDEFANYDGDPVAIRMAPLAQSSKLAFLSVMNSNTTTQKDGVPRGIVSIIFEFAAQCRKRRVTVQTKPRQSDWDFMWDSLDELDNMVCPCCGGGRMDREPLAPMEVRG